MSTINRFALALTALSLTPALSHAEAELGSPDDQTSEVTATAAPSGLEPTPLSHLDIALGVGVLTAGAGVSVGYRSEIGFRAEGGLGTFIMGTGVSAGAGGSFLVLDRGSHRLEVPVMMYGIAATCGSCDTDSQQTDVVAFAGATGLDWTVGRTAKATGFLLTLRGGLGMMNTQSSYDHSERASLMPVFQLGAGWAI